MEKDRVKIIRNIREEQLQFEVNAFIEKNSCRVRKIMFQQAALGSYMSYSAMIYYEKVDLAPLTEGQDEQNEDQISRYPKLAEELQRMASSGSIGNMSEWGRFMRVLNDSLKKK